MIDSLIWILLGAFIGWHVPQPSWAVVIKDKILGMLKNDSSTL